MSTTITTLKDKSGNTLHPITKTECVYDSNSNNVESLFDGTTFHDDSVTTVTETTFADNYYTKTQTDSLIQNFVNFDSMTTLYSTSSVSTGTKTLSDSLANYKLLLIGQYTTNSGGWTFQTIPRVLFDTMTSSSTGLWVTQYSGSNRRIYIYKVSNTQIYLYNVDGSDKVAIYGLK